MRCPTRLLTPSHATSTALGLVASFVIACGPSLPPPKAASSPPPPNLEHTQRSTANAAKSPRPGESGKRITVEKVSLKDALRRELPALAKHAIQAPKGAFAAEVEALKNPQVKALSKSASLSIPIGTSTPIQCNIFLRRLDAAGSLRNLLHLISKKATGRGPLAISAHLVEGHPILGLSSLYWIGPKGRRIGMMAKLAVISYPNSTILCMHNEVGYEKTFTRIVNGLARTFHGPKVTSLDKFTYVSVGPLRINDLVVGFVQTFERRKSKHVDTHETMTLLLPRAKGSLLSLDFVNIMSDSAGELESSEEAGSVGGRLAHRISLRREKGLTYTAKGKVNGRVIDATMTSKTHLYVPRAVNKKLWRHFVTRRKANPVSYPEFSASQDAKALTASVFTKIARKGAGAKGPTSLVVQKSVRGKKVTRRILDRNGRLERLTFTMGGTTIVYTREYQHGTP